MRGRPTPRWRRFSPPSAASLPMTCRPAASRVPPSKWRARRRMISPSRTIRCAREEIVARGGRHAARGRTVAPRSRALADGRCRSAAARSGAPSGRSCRGRGPGAGRGRDGAARLDPERAACGGARCTAAPLAAAPAAPTSLSAALPAIAGRAAACGRRSARGVTARRPRSIRLPACRHARPSISASRRARPAAAAARAGAGPSGLGADQCGGLVRRSARWPAPSCPITAARWRMWWRSC